MERPVCFALRIRTHNEFYILFFAALITNILNAQIISYYGIKASVVRSNYLIKDKPTGGYVSIYPYQEEALVHPAIGVYLHHAFGENLGIETELSYMQKGGAYTYDAFSYVDNLDDQRVIH